MGSKVGKNNSRGQSFTIKGDLDIFETALYQHFGDSNKDIYGKYESNIERDILNKIIESNTSKSSLSSRLRRFVSSNFQKWEKRFALNLILLIVVVLLSISSLFSIYKLDRARTAKYVDNALIEVSNSISEGESEYDYLDDIDSQLEELEQI
jgi:hypothetical protein